jgi:flagellar biosynthesis chaperone FliJ
MTQRGSFIYGLHGLLRKRGLDLELAKEGLAAASAHLAARTRELELSSARLMELEGEQRTLSQQGTLIDVDVRMRLHACLREAVVRRKQHATQLEQATAQHQKAHDVLLTAHQELKAIERHREQAVAQFDTAQRRRAQHETDELYLSNARAQVLATRTESTD